MSGYRPLAPSNSQAESSSSSPAQAAENSSAGGATASGVLSGAVGGGGGSGNEGDAHQRKRRTAGNVSTMACTPCRTARQKVRADRSTPSSDAYTTGRVDHACTFVRAKANLRACFSFYSVTGPDRTFAVDVLHADLTASTNHIPKHTRTTSSRKSRICGKTTPTSKPTIVR